MTTNDLSTNDASAMLEEAARRRRRGRLLRLLSGRGLEIGALHVPVRAPHLDVRNVDRLPVDALREHYPELAGRPLAPVDVLDDAETLATIADGSQDFVIANHVIEHMADPIGAMLAWQRVLVPGGRVFLAVPDRDATFERDRPLTTLEHLRDDHERPSPERDREAFREFARHVPAGDGRPRGADEVLDLARRMEEARYSIHYHVWDERSFDAFLAFLPAYLGDLWRLRCSDAEPSGAGEFLSVLEKR